MITKTRFRTTSKQEETFEDSPQSIVFRCQYTTGVNLRGNLFPWHWHSAFEIDLVTGCDARFEFEGTTLEIPAGNAVFINSQKLHAYHLENPSKCRIYALLFDPVLLAGNYNGEIFQKYVAPVMNSEISGWKISSSDPAFACVKEIIRLSSEEPKYYEIRVRTQLEELWCSLLDGIAAVQLTPSSHKEDSARIKEMLNYIHTHYGERLSLDKIASAASVGTRECSRCFQRSIRQSPMDYVNFYRIQIALELLTSTDHTITEISELCGFSSLSYFGKVFRQHTGVTPVQYRRNL